MQKLQIKNIFRDINDISSYWAGFIAADGNISGYNKFSLGVAEKDKLQLFRFMNDIKSTHKVSIRKDKFHSISIRDTDVCESLLTNFNIMPRKSLSFKVPNLSREMMPHFLRGLFDGDGCISHSGKYLHISLCSGSLACIDSVRDFIYNECWISSSIGGTERAYTIQYCGSSAVEVVRLLYEDASRYLERKRDRCASVLV